MNAAKTTVTAPRLRFPEFNGNWEEKRLGDVAKFSKGKGIAKADISIDGTTPCIRYAELYTTYGEVITEAVSHTNLDVDDLTLSSGGEVIIPASGEKSEGIARACAVLTVGIALGGDLNVLSTNEDSAFLARYISSALKSQLAKHAQGHSVVHLYSEHIKPVKINLPHPDEQAKVAAFLGAVDTRLAGLKARHKCLTEYKHGVMQRLFSQALRFTQPDGTPFPDWEEKRLGDVAKFSKGKGIAKADISIDGTTPCIRYAELYTTYGEVITEAVSHTNLDVDDLTLSSGGEVIIPASGEKSEGIARACAVLTVGIALGGDLNVLSTNEDSAFLARYISSALKSQLAKHAQGHSVVHLYSEHIKPVKINLPHPDEQAKIADFLSAIDRRIDLLSQQLTVTEGFKKFLLQQMFV